jgi:ribose 5-phosphate isomerase A
MSAETQKKAAAEEAAKHIIAGSKLGLGTGSTANYFIEAIARRVKKEGLDLTCVPTSAATRELAERLGLKMGNLEETAYLDITVDGADEFDSEFRLIKGGGGAMHREKLVASSSRFMVVIADQSKQVKTLGKFPLPVEVSRFGVKATAWKMERAFEHLNLKAKMTLRMRDGQPFVTESGNAIIDCALGAIPEPEKLDALLNNTPGVIETGLFLGICGVIYVAGPDGVTELTRK